MKKKNFLFVLSLVIIFFGYNDLKANGWVTKGNVSLFLNEVALSNWAKGGESQVALTGLFGYFVSYYTPDSNFIWENTFSTGYGFQTSDQYSYRKNEDKLELDSKTGYRAIQQFYYSLSFSFQTQFDKGYKYPDDSNIVSKFFAPAYFILSLGMDFKPTSNFSVSFSPISGRLILVEDNALANTGSYGVNAAKYDDSTGKIISPGEHSRFDFGVAASVNYTFSPMENINISTKLDLYNNYTDPNIGNRRNIDVNSETAVNLKVNSYISASIFLHLIYDQDIPVQIFKTINGAKTFVGVGPRLQMKQTLGIGFSYNV
jgi:hypothetical protein